MTSQSPSHRGNVRRFDKLRENGDARPTKVVTLADVIIADELVELCQDLIDEGYALSVSRTRDGGALCFGFLMGGKPFKRYTPTREAWLALLDELSG